MKFVKLFPKFQKHLLFTATSTLPQNLQEAAVTLCSENFENPSQESLPKFKEHLFLMTTFQVYHMGREYEEGSSKFTRVKGGSVNVWGIMGGRDSPQKGKWGVWGRDFLEKGKYLANSYTAARVNVNYEILQFFSNVTLEVKQRY